MAVDRSHPNYSKHPALKGKVISYGAANGNRSDRRGRKFRDIVKQIHLVGRAQVRMGYEQRGIIGGSRYTFFK